MIKIIKNDNFDRQSSVGSINYSGNCIAIVDIINSNNHLKDDDIFIITDEKDFDIKISELSLEESKSSILN